MMMNPNIVGWGADARMEDRPGVPREIQPPQPIGNGELGIPVQQTIGKPTAKSPLKALTPVYGTAQPASGLSGVMRRMAYGIPDYKPSRWLLLIMADKVDVLEHNPLRLLTMGALLTVGVLGLRRALR